MNNLKTKYEKEIKAKLASELGLKNLMSIPKVSKIVINMGIGVIARNKILLEETIKELAIISGQKPAVRKARVSVASFNLRKGMPVGLTVTLRGIKMYDFLAKLISIVLPRIRDFRGVSQGSFDGHGNYTLGISEHNVFPEIDTAKISGLKGLEITIVTSSKDKDKSRRLLECLGMPFKK